MGTLKSIFDMVKTDRYTQDGRDELAKLQETEDVKYKTGDISQKTGLQKQPDGSWAPPKKGGAGAKKEGLTNAEGKLSERAKFAYQEHAKKISNESLESLIRNKNKAFEKHNDEIAEIFKEELARRQKENSIKSQEKKNWEDFFSETDKKIAAAGNAEKLPEAKFDEYGLPDDETIAMKNLFLQKENVADPNKLTNAEFNALAKKLDSELGIGNMERAQELLVTPRENPDYPFKPKTSEERAERAKFEKDRDDFIERMNKYREESKTQKDPKEIIATPGKLATQEQTDAATAIADKNSYSFETMMEKFPIQKIQQFANSKVDDFEGGIDKYIEFKAEGRTGVDMEEVGKDFAKLINHNVARRIWNGYTNGSLKVDEKGFFKPAASADAAPRELTGDCRIRIRKEKPKLTGDTRIRVKK